MLNSCEISVEVAGRRPALAARTADFRIFAPYTFAGYTYRRFYICRRRA